MSDPAKYRTKEEVEAYKKKDPLEIVKQTILDKKYANEKWLDEVEAEIENEVNESVTFAENSPYPEAQALFEDVYSEPNYPFITE